MKQRPFDDKTNGTLTSQHPLYQMLEAKLLHGRPVTRKKKILVFLIVAVAVFIGPFLLLF